MNLVILKQWFSQRNHHTQEILKGAIGAFILKVLAAGVAFGYNVLLARLLGAENTGVYFLSFTIVFIGATVGRFGLDNTVLRYVSIARSNNNSSLLLGVYRKAAFITASFSIVVTLIIELLSVWISEHIFSDPNLVTPIQIMALSITPIALFTIHASALQGMKRIKEYITVLSLWNPLFALVGVMFFVPKWGVEGAVFAYTIGSVITLTISYIQWKKTVEKLKVDTVNFDTQVILQSCIPLFVSSLLRLVIERSSIIMLGVWVVSTDVGVYSAAYRMAMLTSFILVAVNSISAPLFASLHEQGRMEELEHTAKTTAKILILIATPILIFCVMFSELLMSVFGTEFTGGSNAFVILSIGQYVNLITGSVGYLLVMSGHERMMRNNLIFNAILCVTLNALLIPWYGMLGASIATALTIATQNIIATYLVKKKLGFVVLPFIFNSKFFK